jgi:Fungal Zn(2)-Cys(6) binuclear cluster domain
LFIVWFVANVDSSYTLQDAIMENTSLSPAPVEAQARQKPSGTKRIKISRACDECRKRKVLFFIEPSETFVWPKHWLMRCGAHILTLFLLQVKCDGAQPCYRCRKSETPCIFVKSAPRRGPPKQYVELLETRLRMVEKALTFLEKSNDEHRVIGDDDDGVQADWDQPRYGTLGFILTLPTSLSLFRSNQPCP